MFIYAHSTKQSDIQLQMQQVSQFAVFGFNTFKQDIIESNIFVTINYSILSGALICMQCDIDIKQSCLQFVARGVQISALILHSINTVQIYDVTISFRFWSNFSSGLVNQINNTLVQFQIAQLIITGYNYIISATSGYICSRLFTDIQIQAVSFQVCVENTQRLGFSSFIATLSQPEISTCANICPSTFVLYGICAKQPQFSILLQNLTVICEHPFVFNSQLNTCECDFGFFLNISFCVNVIEQFSNTQKNATILESILKNEIQRTEILLKTAFIDLQQLIITNISDLAQTVNSNDLIINNNILNTNQSVNNNINELRQENTQQFNNMTSQIETKHIQVTNLIDTNFNTQMELINNYQTDLKNNFSSQKEQISDFRANTVSSFNLVESLITNFQNDNKMYLGNLNMTVNNQLDAQKVLATDNQLIVLNNFAVQKDFISSLKNTQDVRFSTIDLSIQTVNTKLDNIKSQLTSAQTSVETKIAGVQTYITGTVATQQYLKDVYNSLSGTISTQSYLRDVYNSLLNAVNGIKASQDPCKAWPGSINQGGLCKCVYINEQSAHFCPNLNKCCNQYTAEDAYGPYTAFTCPGLDATTNCQGARAYANDSR
ncbi:Hypothetical_protein [Hexamita inflata]|uniref:Hypothetical_protein n=1 Tax=Hexamita inflata TaxID=28002 RepID=A0ABP1GGI6_9EUKA